MDIIGTIIGGVASIGSGAVTGLLGLGLGKLFDWLNAREQRAQLEIRNKHELDMVRANGEILDKEWAGRTRIAEVEASAVKDKAASEAFARSYDADNGPPLISAVAPPQGGMVARAVQGLGWLLMVTIEVVRGIIRPGLTIYLAVICTLMYYEARTAIASLGPHLYEATMADVYKSLVYTFLYLFTTAFVWWFGVRNSQQPPTVGKR